MGRAHRKRRLSWLGLLALVQALDACNSAPSQAVLGSYFPSWMLCVGLGGALTVLAYAIVESLGLAHGVPLPLLTWLAFLVAASFASWLLWLG